MSNLMITLLMSVIMMMTMFKGLLYSPNLHLRWKVTGLSAERISQESQIFSPSRSHDR